jgi:PAS domain S-box-containing protein
MDDSSPNAMRQLIHELRVHQIELEMQNDELRRTQAERDAADARYFDFYDLAPVGYVTVSEQGLMLHSNLTAAALLGVARSQLAGRAFSRFIEREDQGTYYLMRKQLLETSAAQSCELRMRKRDGSSFFARLDASAARGDDDAPVLRLVLIDVTEKNAAAAAAAEAFMQDILNSVNAEIAVLDSQGIIRAVNEPWQRFARDNSAKPGTPAPHTGIGTSYLAACQADANDPLHSATAARDGIQAVLNGALPSFTLEYPCHTATQQHWFSLRALPLGKDPKAGITITHTDITAYKRAEEELRIAAVAFEAQEAIVVLDSQRRVLRTNQAFTQITGYSEDDMLGKLTTILSSSREPASLYESILRDTELIGKRYWACWLQHHRGEDFFAQGTATAIKNNHGDTTHYVVIFSDHTESHQREQQRMVHEAAHREALVREVHHRIKNNLQGIGGLLQQFARLNPEIAEQMQLVAGHLNGISVIHGLQGRHEKSRVRLCELTREIAQATSTIWQTPIDIDIPAHWRWRVVAEKDAVSIALVLNELLVNAVKHGGKAQGHVSVTLRQGRGAEGVELTILNAGHLRNNQDRPTAHHHGLQLIESLQPRVGFTMTLAQNGEQVQTLLQMTAPVLALDTES